jgi:ABC-2 type transport system permease protein
MSATLTIAKRELRASFDTAVPYVVLCLGLPVLALFFFRTTGGFWQANRASLESLILYVSRGVAVLASVLTMRVMAEERRSGTLEMLITLPVRDHQVILGKFLGTWAVVLLGVLGTLLFPLMMFGWPWKLGPLDWGPLWAGYLGILLSSAATVAIGMLISSLTESQVIAFFVTFAVTLVLHLSGAFVDSIEYPLLRRIVAFISFDAKIATLARGLVTTRDVLYFLSIAVMCLMASFHALERRKWA